MRTHVSLIAALVFMALRPAHATEIHVMQCGNKLIDVYGHHGYEFTELKGNPSQGFQRRNLPCRFFRNTDGDWYFRGKNCHLAPPESYCDDPEERTRFLDIDGRIECPAKPMALRPAQAGENVQTDEALIDTWERMKVPPALPLPPVRPGMIYVFRPPPEYDKPFDGLLVIQEFRGEEMKGACFRRGFACEEFVAGNPNVCIVKLLMDMIKPPINREETIRHEIGHCNGWPGNHPDSKWEWVVDPEEPPKEPEGPPVPMTIIKKVP